MNQTLTRLQPGHVVEFNGEEWIVTYVNESRARIVPREKKQITITTSEGLTANFQRHGGALDISPNSELRIVGREKLPTVVKRKPVAIKR